MSMSMFVSAVSVSMTVFLYVFVSEIEANTCDYV